MDGQDNAFRNHLNVGILRSTFSVEQYLQTSTSNLDLVQTSMNRAIEHKARELESIIASERIRIPHVFRLLIEMQMPSKRKSLFPFFQPWHPEPGRFVITIQEKNLIVPVS